MRSKFKIVFLICLFSSGLKCYSQNLGVKIGLTISLGTHVNSIGVNSQLYYQNYFFQLNAGNQLKFNLTSFGSRKLFFENRMILGGVLLAGKRTNTIDFHFDGLNHNSNYQYGLSYNYIWYQDNRATSQVSGGWGLHIDKVSILFENDVFGGQARDRFRTGALLVSYRNQQYKFFSKLYLWTGETKKSIWIKDPQNGCPNGYRSLENLPYGKTSHGIFAIGIMTDPTISLKNPSIPNPVMRNLVSLSIGFDSEQVRHFFQNRITHDLVLLPKKVKRNTPHYPRLNSEGLPVFNKTEMRKNKFYFQSSVNEVWSN
jgi:hypothetical protein